MTIRIQLWKGDEQIGPDHFALYSDDPADAHWQAADKIIDRLITEVHRGDYGRGEFRIEADHRSATKVFIGAYYRCAITYPKQHAAQHARS